MVRQLPRHLSDLLNRLGETGRSFIDLYEDKKDRMQAIASTLQGISTEVKEMHKDKKSTGSIGSALGAVGIAAALVGGLCSASAGKLLVFGGALAFSVGTAAIVTANVTKGTQEKKCILKVEELFKEFMTITEWTNSILNQIKHVSAELEQNVSSLMTRTREQAEISLVTTEQLQQFPQQIADLAEQSKKCISVTENLHRHLKEVFHSFISLGNITATNRNDKKLSSCIARSASLCQKIANDLAKMRMMFEDFK